MYKYVEYIDIWMEVAKILLHYYYYCGRPLTAVWHLIIRYSWTSISGLCVGWGQYLSKVPSSSPIIINRKVCNL